MRRAIGVLVGILALSAGLLASPNPSLGQVPSDVATGAGPASVALDPSTGQLFVENSQAGDVSILNTHTNTVTATLPVVGPIAVDPTTGLAFVAGSSLYAIGESTDTIVWSAPTRAHTDVVVDPSRGLVFVSNEDQTISVYGEQARQAVGLIGLSLSAVTMAVDPSVGRLFAAAGTSVAVVDLSTYTVSYWTETSSIFSLAVDQTANHLYVGMYVYVPNFPIVGGEVVVLDPETGSSEPGVSIVGQEQTPPPWGVVSDPTAGSVLVIEANKQVQEFTPGSARGYQFTLPSDAGGLAVDPSSGLVYIADSGSAAVSIFDPYDNTLVTQVAENDSTGPGLGTAMAVNPASGVLYTGSSGAVWGVDARTLQTEQQIPVSGSVVSLAVDSALNRVYATTANGLVVIDGVTGSVLTTVSTGSANSSGVAVDDSSHMVYVTNTDPNGTVTVVDGTTDTVVGAVPVGELPEAVAVDSVDHKVVVADGLGIQIVDEITQSVSATIPFRASALAVDPSEGLVFAAGASNTARIDIDSAAITKEVAVVSYAQSGLGSNGMAINPARDIFYPAMLGENLNQEVLWPTDSSPSSTPAPGVRSVAVDAALDTWYESSAPNGYLTEYSSGRLPAAPTITTSAPGNRSISVVWAAPSDTGASQVTSYAVAAAPTNGSPASVVTVPGNQNEAVFSGLRNDTTYVVTVTASNSYGAGDPSTAVSVTPQGPPAQTTTSVSAPPSADYGQQSNVTAFVSPVPDGGTVAFYNGETLIQGCGARPVSSSSGQASCTFTETAVGTRGIGAIYSGDPDYAPHGAGSTNL